MKSHSVTSNPEHFELPAAPFCLYTYGDEGEAVMCGMGPARPTTLDTVTTQQPTFGTHQHTTLPSQHRRFKHITSNCISCTSFNFSEQF